MKNLLILFALLFAANQACPEETRSLKDYMST